MRTKASYAEQILNNIRMSSDGATFQECYLMCANKKDIYELKTADHQIVWGRRGTGKTTLLKAFCYYINELEHMTPTHAFYVMMADCIPESIEFNQEHSSPDDIALYILLNMLEKLCNLLEQFYNLRSKIDMSDADQLHFSDAYDKLDSYLKQSRQNLLGAKMSISKEESETVGKSKAYASELSLPESTRLSKVLNIKSGRVKENSLQNKVTFSGELCFKFETAEAADYIRRMLSALGVEHCYICIDEFSELHKLDDKNIQIKVANLIKKMFFKQPVFSVKISSIWSHTNLHSHGREMVEGIEYQQDIFRGPDLDVTFMSDNEAVTQYFKDMLVNIYFLDSGKEASNAKKAEAWSTISSCLISEETLSHLICGAQGVSRIFAALVRNYLNEFIRSGTEKVSGAFVFNSIIDSYFDNVRSKIPYFKVFRAIEKFIRESKQRFFLISEEDYQRCKRIIQCLAARGVYMQIPSRFAPAELDHSYRVFIIHYGLYLHSMDFKKGRKQFQDDSKSPINKRIDFIPDLSTEDIIENSVVTIEGDAELELCCPYCSHLFIPDAVGLGITEARCPSCGENFNKNAIFIDDVAL